MRDDGWIEFSYRLIHDFIASTHLSLSLLGSMKLVFRFKPSPLPPPSFLNATGFRPPNIFMYLQLHSHLESAASYPFGEFLEIDLAPGGRYQHSARALLQLEALDH